MFLVDRNRCIGCGKCTKVCPQGAIRLLPWEHKVVVKEKEITAKKVAHIYSDLCICCGECHSVCPTGAILRVPRRMLHPSGSGGRGRGRGYGRGRRRFGP